MGKRGPQPEPITASPPSDVLPVTASSFASVYHSHFVDVRRFLARWGISVALLDDLTQEVFLRAWAGRNGFRGNASIKTWLSAIACNVAREWRREKPVAVAFEEEDLPTEDRVSQVVADREQAQAAQVAVAQLPPKQQQAIKLVCMEGLAPAEAAARAKCLGQVFRRRLADARAQLRRMLGSGNAD